MLHQFLLVKWRNISPLNDQRKALNLITQSISFMHSNKPQLRNYYAISNTIA